MEIMEFCQKIKSNLTNYIGDKVSVHVKQITKNNGVVLHSIIVTEQEMNISPNIYVDDLYEAYEKGETFRTIMDEVFEIYENSRVKNNIDMGFFMDYGIMQEKVLYKVISYEKNKELLLDVPYIPVMDLALVFYCFVPQRELGNATILIYNNHLKMWDITKEQLYQAALKNTERIMPPKILSIEDMMKEIFSKELLAGEQKSDKTAYDQQTAEQMLQSASECRMNGKMFVFGNSIKLFGAAVMFYDKLLKKFADRLQKNIFILPSSIHEVIIVPDDEEQEAENLWKMVCEINATQVEAEEVLTDSVYYYSRKNSRIEKLF